MHAIAFCAYADANECSVVPDPCNTPLNSSCYNTPGSYECRCNDGLGKTYGFLHDLSSFDDIRCAGELLYLLRIFQ